MKLLNKFITLSILLSYSFTWAQFQVKEYLCQEEKLMFEKDRKELFRLNKKTIEDIIKCNPDTKIAVFFYPLWCEPAQESFYYLTEHIDLKEYTLLITSVEKEDSKNAIDFYNTFYTPEEKQSKWPFPVFILSDEYLSGMIFRASNKGKNFLAQYNKTLTDGKEYGSVAIFNRQNELIYFGNFKDYLETNK